MIPKESKYFVIRGVRLFEILKNFSSAAQYVVKCFRIATDDVIGARAAYSGPFEKKYKWPGDGEEDIRVFDKLRTSAFKSMQELNKFAGNFEKMRKQLFRIKMHFVQHDLLDLLDYYNRKIFVTQLEQRAIEYEKLSSQKKVQVEAATKVLKQPSLPMLPAEPSNTKVEHHKASHAASLPQHTTNTKKESGVGNPFHNQIPSAMSLTTYLQVRQHDTAMHVTAPQSYVTRPSTTLGQRNRDQVSPIMSCDGGSKIHKATPANSAITDIPIDPILLSQGQSHRIPQSSAATGVKGHEIHQPSPSVTFATPPRNVIPPSGPPREPRFPNSSPNTVIIKTPRNHHGLPAFPPATPPMKSGGPSGTLAQLCSPDSSPPIQVLQTHLDSEFGLLGAAMKPNGLRVSQGYSCNYDNLRVPANADLFSGYPQVRTLEPPIPIRDPPLTAAIPVGLHQHPGIQSNHSAGGAVGRVPRQVHDKTSMSRSLHNAQ